MRFPAVTNATVRSAQWIAANELAGWTWTKLCFRASEDENGGRFGGASTWGESIWLPMANVTMAGIEAAVEAGLCHWEGDTLVVRGYDVTSDKKLATIRKNGRKGGRPKKPTEKPNGFQESKPNAKPPSLPSPSSPSPTLPLQKKENTEPASPELPTARDFIGVFCEEWESAYGGEKYRPTPRDAGKAKAIAAETPEVFAEWRAIARRYVRTSKLYYLEARHPLHLLVGALNEFTGEVRATSPPNGKPRDVKVGHFAAPGPEFRYPSGEQKL